MLFDIPNPLYSYQQFIRFNHLDIPDLKDDELRDELWALRSWLYGLPPQHWIRERTKELGKEYGRRHYIQNVQKPKITQKTEDYY